MYLMKGQRLLRVANTSMGVTLGLFVGPHFSALWGMEGAFGLMTTAILHLAQIVLAGLFKLSYVFRLIAQNQLGQRPALTLI